MVVISMQFANFLTTRMFAVREYSIIGSLLAALWGRRLKSNEFFIKSTR